MDMSILFGFETDIKAGLLYVSPNSSTRMNVSWYNANPTIWRPQCDISV